VTPEAALGQVLREERMRRHLSQEQLAQAAGYSRNYISLIELGTSSASVGALFRLARCLDLLPSDLVRLAEARVTTLPAREQLPGPAPEQ
jgi:transcriptional regulator with XRE-family HTH domain